MKRNQLLKKGALIIAVMLSLTSCGKLTGDGELSMADGIYIGNGESSEFGAGSEYSNSEQKKDENFVGSSDNGMAGSGESIVTTPDTQPESETKIENVKSVIRTEATQLRLTETVLKRSVLDSGNMTRVANVIKKAIKGETVTIGVIGGSITNGTGASASSKKYAERFKTWWKSTFPNSTLTFINAGIGATDSMIGVHRADADLLCKNPDLVIVEFSVNDTASKSSLYRESYESLIRKILKKNNNPAVICLALFNQEGTTMQTVHYQVAKHYDVPMISYINAIWPSNATKIYSWSEIGADNVHPNDTGHAVISELLIYYINTVRAQIVDISSKVSSVPSPLTEARFESGVLYTSKTVNAEELGSFKVNSNAFWQFKDGWTVSGGSEPIVFKSAAKSIYILYKMDKTGGKAGTVTVKLDGETVGTINSDYSTGWGDYAYFYKVLESDSVKEHKIEIQLTSTGNKSDFAILGIMTAK